MARACLPPLVLERLPLTAVGLMFLYKSVFPTAVHQGSVQHHAEIPVALAQMAHFCHLEPQTTVCLCAHSWREPQISQDGESDPPEERPLALCHPLPSEDFGLGPTRRRARPEARGDVRGSQPVENEPLWASATAQEVL